VRATGVAEGSQTTAPPGRRASLRRTYGDQASLIEPGRVTAMRGSSSACGQPWSRPPSQTNRKDVAIRHKASHMPPLSGRGVKTLRASGRLRLRSVYSAACDLRLRRWSRGSGSDPDLWAGVVDISLGVP
jgi:hypothetical protein